MNDDKQIENRTSPSDQNIENITMRTYHLEYRYWLLVMLFFLHLGNCAYAQSTRPASGKAKVKPNLASATISMLGENSWKALQLIDSYKAAGYEVSLDEIEMTGASGKSWHYNDLSFTTKAGRVTEILAIISTEDRMCPAIQKAYRAITSKGSRIKPPGRLQKRFPGKEFWSLCVSGKLNIIAVVTPLAFKHAYDWRARLLLLPSPKESAKKRAKAEKKQGAANTKSEKDTLLSKIPIVAGIPILLGSKTDCLLSFAKHLRHKIRQIVAYSLVVEVSPQKTITWKDLRYFVSCGRRRIWSIEGRTIDMGEDYGTAEKAFLILTNGKDNKKLLKKTPGIWSIDGNVNVPHLKCKAYMLAKWLFFKGVPRKFIRKGMALSKIRFAIHLNNRGRFPIEKNWPTKKCTNRGSEKGGNNER